jgi:hypothetical protein
MTKDEIPNDERNDKARMPKDDSKSIRHSSFPTYLGGKLFVNSTAQLTQRRRRAASCQPAGSTMTQPRIGRPVMSNSRVCSSARTCRAASGPRRRTRWPFHSPQQTLPASRNAVPPNILFSTTFLRRASRGRSWLRREGAGMRLGAADWSIGCVDGCSVFWRKFARGESAQSWDANSSGFARLRTARDPGAQS